MAAEVDEDLDHSSVRLQHDQRRADDTRERYTILLSKVERLHLEMIAKETEMSLSSVIGHLIMENRKRS
jgi:hypothetical protein